jgi:ectoine hydroxylase-related dioxygenase (phytanoyl-CoA dioxygenase family)
VPSLYRDRAGWPVDPVIDEGEACWYPSTTGYEIVNVPASRGDVIVWESRLPHANSRNLSPYPRLAFYVSFYPGSPEDREVTAECTRSGLCHPGWRGWPGHGHREEWAPPRLTGLGRKIAGLAEWL